MTPIYMTFRTGDAAAFALSLRRGWSRLAPDIELVTAPISLDAPAPTIPAGATVFVLVGPRWLRSEPGDPSFLGKASDPMRRLLEASLRDGHRIVPVLFEVSVSDWGAMCREFPSTLQSLAPRNAVALRSQSFSQDLQLLIVRLRAPAADVPWTEAGSRSVIRVEAAGGGALKWWSNRGVAARVFVDGSEVGSLGAWNGQMDWPVAPGPHTVQVRPGPGSSKSSVLALELAKGETVAFVCDRNIFTGGLSLRRKN